MNKKIKTIKDKINTTFVPQNPELQRKKKQAEKHINTAMALAAAVGAIPIPFSDALLLVPIQVKMIAGITKSYEIDSIAAISKQLISDVIITTLGRSAAGGLIKMIPGAGAVAGGVINASVASTITKALGEACSFICCKACEDMINGKNVDFSNLFDNIDFIKDLVSTFFENSKKK